MTFDEDPGLEARDDETILERVWSFYDRHDAEIWLAAAAVYSAVNLASIIFDNNKHLATKKQPENPAALEIGKDE